MHHVRAMSLFTCHTPCTALAMLHFRSLYEQRGVDRQVIELCKRVCSKLIGLIRSCDQGSCCSQVAPVCAHLRDKFTGDCLLLRWCHNALSAL
jgi:hypothetical protein